MKLITIKNVSKDFNYVFVSHDPVTDEVVKDYIESKDTSLDLEVTRLGLFSNVSRNFVKYSVNFVEVV